VLGPLQFPFRLYSDQRFILVIRSIRFSNSVQTYNFDKEILEVSSFLKVIGGYAVIAFVAFLNTFILFFTYEF
jgi:hypothetical protein